LLRLPLFSRVYRNGQIIVNGKEILPRDKRNDEDSDRHDKEDDSRKTSQYGSLSDAAKLARRNKFTVMPGPFFTTPSISESGSPAMPVVDRSNWLLWKTSGMFVPFHAEPEKGAYQAPATKKEKLGPKALMTIRAAAAVVAQAEQRKTLEAANITSSKTVHAAPDNSNHNTNRPMTQRSHDNAANSSPTSTTFSNSSSSATNNNVNDNSQKLPATSRKVKSNDPASSAKQYKALLQQWKQKKELMYMNANHASPGPVYAAVNMDLISAKAFSSVFGSKNINHDLRERTDAFMHEKAKTAVGPGKYDVSYISFGKEPCATTVFAPEYGRSKIIQQRFKGPKAEPFISKDHNQSRYGIYGPGPLYFPKNDSVEANTKLTPRPEIKTYPLGPDDRPRTSYKNPGPLDRAWWLHAKARTVNDRDVKVFDHIENCSPGPAYIKQLSSFEYDGDAAMRKKLNEREAMKRAQTAPTQNSQSARNSSTFRAQDHARPNNHSQHRNKEKVTGWNSNSNTNAFHSFSPGHVRSNQGGYSPNAKGSRRQGFDNHHSDAGTDHYDNDVFEQDD
jgi:hypothetical protein